MGPVFAAKYPGQCWVCPKRFQRGDPIRYVRKGVLVHEGCAELARVLSRPPSRPAPPDPWPAGEQEAQR
jgi:hypothetical protein